MKKIIFPGSFDPPTRGHLDIIMKASKIFDFVYVAVGNNRQKKQATFTLNERLDLLKKITSANTNIEVISFDGLLIDLAQSLKINTILKSIRDIADFENENAQAYINKHLGNIETLYMVADEKYRLISSSLIKEVASFGKRLDDFVPKEIEPFVFERLSQK